MGLDVHQLIAEQKRRACSITRTRTKAKTWPEGMTNSCSAIQLQSDPNWKKSLFKKNVMESYGFNIVTN